MSKRTLALIAGLSLITIVLLVIAVAASQNAPKQNPQLPPVVNPSISMAPKDGQAKTRMYLSPNPAITTSSTGTLQVIVDADDNNLSAVQIELQYDPQAISTISIKPGTFFDTPIPLINNINKAQGRISYALGVLPNQSTKRGSGTVAVITYTLAPTVNSTQISFLKTSLATVPGIATSVLKETAGTTISLSSNQTKPNVSAPSHTYTPPTQ